MPRVFIGRVHDLYGKSMWELLCNLKDFGVGRVVMKTKENRKFPERSWYRVLKVEPEMDPENRHGKVTVRRVFRGVEEPADCVLSRTTAVTDYQLVPRHEEAAFCQLDAERAAAVAAAARLPPADVAKPPLLLELERMTSRDSDVNTHVPAFRGLGPAWWR